MSPAFLLLLVAATPPQNAAQAAGLAAAHDYGSCVGMAATLNSVATQTIEEAITSAFERCAAKRQTTLAAMIAGIETLGLSAARASREAEQALHENEQLMADRLRTDIATFRRTGHAPANAPN